MADLYEEYRKKVEGTNINPHSLLSTDYFNHFNTVIMLLGMLPDSPEMLVEIDEWTFISYPDHFKQSGLDFASLAIEAYNHAPKQAREQFERQANEMGDFVKTSRVALRKLLKAGDMGAFTDLAQRVSNDMKNMVDAGNAIVHGTSMNQASVDSLFGPNS